MERRQEKKGGKGIDPRRGSEQAARPLCKIGGGKQKEPASLDVSVEKEVRCILDPYCGGGMIPSIVRHSWDCLQPIEGP